MDPAWIIGRPVLLVKDTRRRYRNAAFIRNELARGLRRVFIEVWEFLYFGIPDVLHVDNNPPFMVAAFQKSAARCCVVIKASGIDGQYVVVVR